MLWALWCAVLLLAGAGAILVRSQIIIGTALAPDSTTDASRFPSVDRLPGKVPPQVWKGLAGVWARDHAQWKATASNDVGAVVFLGDSITEGWSTLAEDFPKLKVANRGIGGDITSGVLYRLKADVLSLNPAAIVLLIGTNDVGDGADGEDVAENIRLILLAIKSYNPKLKVIVCKVMPRSDHPNFTEKIQKAKSLSAKSCPDPTATRRFTPGKYRRPIPWWNSSSRASQTSPCATPGEFTRTKKAIRTPWTSAPTIFI